MTKIRSLLTAALLLRLTPALAQTGVVAPNENLVTDGLPPIPVAIAEAARRYSDFHSAAFWGAASRSFLRHLRFHSFCASRLSRSSLTAMPSMS